MTQKPPTLFSSRATAARFASGRKLPATIRPVYITDRGQWALVQNSRLTAMTYKQLTGSLK